MRKIKKLLVANRSEIAIRVLRSAHELGVRTVAVYSHEDRFALHRFKADEAYIVGKVGEPIRAYLDIPGIIAICLAHGIDAIHPGYGFLSENPELRRACEVDDHRMVRRSAFGRKQQLASGRTFRIRSQSINRLRRKGDQSAAAQYLDRPTHGAHGGLIHVAPGAC